MWSPLKSSPNPGWKEPGEKLPASWMTRSSTSRLERSMLRWADRYTDTNTTARTAVTMAMHTATNFSCSFRSMEPPSFRLNFG